MQRSPFKFEHKGCLMCCILDPITYIIPIFGICFLESNPQSGLQPHIFVTRSVGCAITIIVQIVPSGPDAKYGTPWINVKSGYKTHYVFTDVDILKFLYPIWSDMSRRKFICLPKKVGEMRIIASINDFVKSPCGFALSFCSRKGKVRLSFWIDWINEKHCCSEVYRKFQKD